MDPRVSLFGCQIDAVRMPQAVDRVYQWIKQPSGKCRYVVTPNVDHVVQLQTDERLRRAYDDASLVVADGMPVVWASRLLRRPLPERVTGADLVRVYLLGAGPGVAERAAERIVGRWPAVDICGTYSPPFGFEKNHAENDVILSRIAAARPDVLVVGLGAPKQELWVHAHQARIQAVVALCVGATIDFLACEKQRAPTWMRSAGLEWLHRVATEPRRLFMRYLKDAWLFPRLIWREMIGRRVEGSCRTPAARPHANLRRPTAAKLDASDIRLLP
jgi:N-acetylglucosaminyldiphosphoundecaprenol N-acetyl-beta-D-mannosaminyltransferase